MYVTISPLVYLLGIVLGTLLSISSSSLFGMWLGLELNMLSFIPMVVNLDNTKKSSEAAIKYFLVQAMASLIMILAVILFYFYANSVLENLSGYLMNMALLTKLGVSPFYIWFVEVMEGLSWINNFILLTWQKISPLFILSLFFSFKMLLVICILTALTGALLGLNQTSLRKILAFSSISHLGWILGILIFNSNFWVIYFLIYSITSFILCMSFLYFNMHYFSQIMLEKSLDKKFIIFVNLLSLGGLPPLLGFFPKWLAFLILKGNFPLLILLIISSLVTLYYYVRLCFNTFTLSYSKMLWSFKSSYKKNSIILAMTVIFNFTGLLFLNILGV